MRVRLEGIVGLTEGRLVQSESDVVCWAVGPVGIEFGGRGVGIHRAE